MAIPMKRMITLTCAIAATVSLATTALSQSGVIRIAVGETDVDAVAYYVALERAKERGVNYKATTFSKEELSIQAVVSGQADIGIATPYSVIQKSKAPIKGLMQISRLVFFPVVDKQYKSWKDLDKQPFAFHARGSGTEAIGNIIAKRQGIEFGQRSYVPGSGNRVAAMLNGQIKATILDLPNMKILMEKGGDKFAVLPSVDTPASDEILFANTDWMKKNAKEVDIIVEEFAKLWAEMAKNPAIVETERVKRNLMKDLPKEILSKVTAFYTDAVKAGVFDAKGGGLEAAKVDFEFYSEAGQLEGKASDLKVEDFWDFGPLNRARAKIGG